MLQTFNVPAGGRQINAKATFLRYESAGVAGTSEELAVRVDGQSLGTYLPGDAIELPIDGKTWDIAPLSPTQTCIVRLGLGRISSARLQGIVQTTYPIGASVQQIDAVDTGTASASGFQIARTLVAPAVNPRGIRLHSLRVAATANGAGTTDIRMVAAPNQPTALTPPNSWAAGQASATNGATGQEVQQRMNVLIPPSWGLYLCVTNTGTTPPAVVYSSTCFEVL